MKVFFSLECLLERNVGPPLNLKVPGQLPTTPKQSDRIKGENLTTK